MAVDMIEVLLPSGTRFEVMTTEERDYIETLPAPMAPERERSPPLVQATLAAEPRDLHPPHLRESRSQ